ncbi:MAG: helix-turn-helix transcriptional regulator, partial [Patescibacteria group bacterium]|nr:helix-turn-helix transcriptional regulator [Patescibacteria group bacterium]
KLTQSEVAEKAEITTTYYAMMERGEVNPSFDILHKMVKILKVKPSDIFSA